LTSVVDANNQTQRTLTYDAFDRVATSTDSEGYALAYSYDALDRVTQVLYPDGTTTQYTYTRLDLTSVKDRLNRVTSYAYDANRRLTLVTDPLNRVTGYAYYRNGMLAGVTDARGNNTNWDIDIQSRPTAKRYANGRSESYAYEASISRLKSVTDALNQVKTYGYTADDLLKSITYTGAINPTPNVSFAYDPYFPRRTSMTDGTGTTTWSYLPVGSNGALSVAVEDGPYANDTVSYGYDVLGRVATRTVDSANESFSYDALGRLSNHASVLGSFNLGYLGATEQLASRQSSTGSVGTQWTYEPNANDRRLKSIVHSGTGRSFGFTTNAQGLITQMTTISGPTASALYYTYDAADRLTKAPSVPGGSIPGYGYDAADNLTSFLDGIPASYNNVNQIVTRDGVAYTHDANGNLLNDGSRTYAWDAENRLVGIGYIGQAGRSTGLRYDGLGRRLALIEINVATASETRQLWCGQQLCQARTAADVVTQRYFDHGEVTSSGQALYYGVDQLGSVRDVMSVQSGTKVQSYDYAPYGAPWGASTTVNTDLRYAGLYTHAASGLYLANYRAYDANSGRWVSRDPIGEAGGVNLYAYVGGNPVSGIDPYGLFDITNPADWPTIPQGVVNACAGFGDGVSLGATAGIRGLMGTNDAVDFSSPEYLGGLVAGVAVTTRGYATGAELSIGRNFRIAPWGNRTGHPTGQYPHYHRRGAPDANGKTPAGQGIGRHRPWDKKSTDQCGCDRF
jgi:RHS repeat-associated protein